MTRVVYLVLFLIITLSVSGQHVLSLRINQVDSIFLKNNLSLLAKQFDLEIQDALVAQSRAYPNPIFTADVNAIDPQNNELFHVGSSGQKIFAIEQLIILGGKRRTSIEIAKQNKKLAELELEDLLRNLHFQVQSSFYSLYQQHIVLDQYTKQLDLLSTIITSYEAQANKGNIALKDVVRLKSVYLKINNERAELAKSNLAEQQRLQLLLQTPKVILPIVETNEFDSFNQLKDYEELKELAVENRPDLKFTQELKKYTALNLRLQKQLAIPDVALNTSYDQRGGAFQDQVNVGINIPLPLWNRNRGNIKAATVLTKVSDLDEQKKKLEVETDVITAWQDLTRSISEYNKAKVFNPDDFAVVFNGINENFQKRNISILEFVDFFESYTESLSEYERIKNQLAQAAIHLNYVTAVKIF